MKRYIIFAALATLGLSSCDSALERTPQSQLSPENYFRTETDLQLFSNTYYFNLLDDNMFAHQSDEITQLVMSNEMRGGSTRTVPKSGGGWSWGNLRKMNTMLEYIHSCSDEAAVKKYTGVCQFFRAFFYFEKVKRFGDVPWVDVQLGSSDAALYNPRDSREFIMTKMIEDIDGAIENLPSDVSVYRVNKWTALALKSSFCLFEGTFRKYHNLTLEGHDYQYYLNLAAESAKQIIDGGKYKLYNTGKPAQDYQTLFTQEDADKGEFILAIKFDFGLEIFNNSTAFSIIQTQGRPGMTKKIVDSYLMADGTRFTDQAGWQTKQFVEEVTGRDPRLAQTIRTAGYHRIGQTEILAPDFSATVTGFQPVKFVMDPTAGNNGVDRPDRSINDLPVYRYAEVLLNYAEAKAELGTLTRMIWTSLSTKSASARECRTSIWLLPMPTRTGTSNPRSTVMSMSIRVRTKALFLRSVVNVPSNSLRKVIPVGMTLCDGRKEIAWIRIFTECISLALAHTTLQVTVNQMLFFILTLNHRVLFLHIRSVLISTSVMVKADT